MSEWITPMADDDKSTPSSIPAMFQDWIDQLSAAAGYAGGSRSSRPASAAQPMLPGALSAAQMASITDSIAAQRRSIAALQTQLSLFDEQLAALENILGPLAQWTRTWADLEQQVLNLGHRPEVDG
jgi:hypothetical protein